MILDSVSKYLIVDLDSAKTTTDMPWVIDYVDMTTTTLVCGSVDGVTNGVTATTILAAPAASTQRKVNRISITNVDTASKGVSVGLVNVATARPLVGATLQVNDTLQYTDTDGWSVIDGNGNTKTSINNIGYTPENLANKGAASGYAPLDAGSKVPLANLPAAVAGALSYQGTWNAATNTPALASGVGMKGYYYKVSVAGTTSLDGHAVWSVDDAAIFDGATWDILQGGVTSGEVTAALGFTPENAANKDTSGGYVGLTLMAINFWNSAKTFMSRFTNANTAARTYTFQDRDGTIADHTDTLAAFATGGAIAPASINGVTVDATTNKPVTAASQALTFASPPELGSTTPARVNATVLVVDGTPIGATGAFDFKATSSLGYVTGILSNLALNGYLIWLLDIGAGGVNGQANIAYAPGVFLRLGVLANDTITPIIFTVNNNTEAMRISTSGNILIGSATDDGVNKLQVAGSIKGTTTISTGGYTVATLPAGSVGMQAYVTDALAPTFMATIVGGGTVVTPVFYNGTNWIGS